MKFLNFFSFVVCWFVNRYCAYLNPKKTETSFRILETTLVWYIMDRLLMAISYTKKPAGRIRNFFAVTQARAVTLRQAEARMKANTVGTPAKAGTLAKVVKPATACKKANYSRDSIYCTSGMTAAALLTVARPPESVGVSNSRETGNMQQGLMPEIPETAFFA